MEMADKFASEAEGMNSLCGSPEAEIYGLLIEGFLPCLSSWGECFWHNSDTKVTEHQIRRLCGIRSSLMTNPWPRCSRPHSKWP